MKFAISLETPTLKNICERMLLKKFVTIAITDPFQKNGTIKLYEDFSFFLWITGGISNGKHSGIKIPGIRL